MGRLRADGLKVEPAGLGNPPTEIVDWPRLRAGLARPQVSTVDKVRHNTRRAKT